MAGEFHQSDGLEPVQTEGLVHIEGNTIPVTVVHAASLLQVEAAYRPVFLIRPDGTIQWNGHEVETDAQLREAILQFVHYVQYGTLGDAK